jgi:hypothetical protein
MTSVLRLGVYRERIEKYGGRVTSSIVNDPQTPTALAQTGNDFSTSGQHSDWSKDSEELLTVTLERQPGRQLGIRLSAGSALEAGIFISDIQVSVNCSLFLFS